MDTTPAAGATVMALLAAPQAATAAPAPESMAEPGAPLARAHAHND
ncbi:hypothetical protein [Kocuria arenosa]